MYLFLLFFFLRCLWEYSRLRLLLWLSLNIPSLVSLLSMESSFAVYLCCVFVFVAVLWVKTHSLSHYVLVWLQTEANGAVLLNSWYVSLVTKQLCLLVMLLHVNMSKRNVLGHAQRHVGLCFLVFFHLGSTVVRLHPRRDALWHLLEMEMWANLCDFTQKKWGKSKLSQKGLC